MQHVIRGQGRHTAHPHASVAEARQCEYDALEAEAEVAAEQANERWFEERGGGMYAGSPEEARDRYLDSLIVRWP